MAETHLRADSACANPIARREALAALFVAPVALAPAAALAAPLETAPTWEDPVTTSRRVDTAFWQAHGKERRLHRHWVQSFKTMRGSPHHDKVTGNWCARHSVAETAAILAPVSTLPALFAKIQIIRDAEMDCELQLGTGLTAHDVLLFDVERMMKAEYLA